VGTEGTFPVSLKRKRGMRRLSPIYSLVVPGLAHVPAIRVALQFPPRQRARVQPGRRGLIAALV